MHRIDSAGATGTGQWTEGNPGTGTPATEITADWMNAVQNELETVIVTGAGIPLNKASNAQLLAALQAIIDGRALPSYTVAGVPSATGKTGVMVFISNESGGSIPAFSDGTNWRRVTDRAIIS